MKELQKFKEWLLQQNYLDRNYDNENSSLYQTSSRYNGN